MHTRAGAPASRSVVGGAALLGLAGVVAYVVTGAVSWASPIVLAAAIGLAGYTIARAGLVPRPCCAARGSSRDPCGTPGGTIALRIIAGAVAVSVAVAIDDQLRRGLGVNGLVGAWAASVALVLLSAWWPEIAGAARRLRAGGLSWPRPRAVFPWAVMTLVAAAPRLLALDRFATVVNGDEGSFMVLARQAQHGELPNVFAPGFWGSPNLYPAMEGWLARVVGSAPADYRLVSAIVGAIGVLATWRLGRRLLGADAGLAAGVILATMPLNLMFSRSALNNITDATALAVALLFLSRAAARGSAGDATLAGIALGFGFSGYFGGRALPAVLLAALALLTLGRRVRPGAAIRLGAWMTTGFAVTAMPLLLTYRLNPAEFGGRMSQVSPFTREALAADPTGTTWRYLANLRGAVLSPFTGTVESPGFYMHEAPLLGWAIAILLAFGAVACAVRVARDRDVALVALVAAPAAMLLAGVALTVPLGAQRLLALTPLWAVVAGAGLALLARWVATIGPAPAGRAALAVVLAVMATTDLRWFASEDRQMDTYGDTRTTMMWDIGWRASRDGSAGAEAPAILFAGPPYVYTGGFNNLVIQAPALAMTDVTQSLDAGPWPALPEGTMLVIVPERAEERCAAEAEYPSATVAEARDRYGELLYVALYRAPLAGWSDAETPAETTFAVVTDSPCATGQGRAR